MVKSNVVSPITSVTSRTRTTSSLQRLSQKLHSFSICFFAMVCVMIIPAANSASAVGPSDTPSNNFILKAAQRLIEAERFASTRNQSLEASLQTKPKQRLQLEEPWTNPWTVLQYEKEFKRIAEVVKECFEPKYREELELWFEAWANSLGTVYHWSPVQHETSCWFISETVYHFLTNIGIRTGKLQENGLPKRKRFDNLEIIKHYSGFHVVGSVIWKEGGFHTMLRERNTKSLMDFQKGSQTVTNKLGTLGWLGMGDVVYDFLSPYQIAKMRFRNDIKPEIPNPGFVMSPVIKRLEEEC